MGKNQESKPEPEPLEKKSGAGAGAAIKLSGSPALDYVHVHWKTVGQYNYMAELCMMSSCLFTFTFRKFVLFILYFCGSRRKEKNIN